MPLARLAGLARYMFASIPARITTGGSAVATILLARTYGMDGKTAGAMAACAGCATSRGLPIFSAQLACLDTTRCISRPCEWLRQLRPD